MSDEFDISLIANDLKISRIKDESTDSFNCRVLYSAMGCWVRTICMDRDEDTSEPTIGVSSQHLSRRANEILKQFCLYYPEANAFFGEKGTTDAISVITNRLRRHEEIVRVGLSGKWALPALSMTYLGQSVYLARGTIFDFHVCYSGLTTVFVSEPRSNKKPVVMPVENWLESFTSCLSWKPINVDLETLEFFDPSLSFSNNYKAWSSQVPKDLPFLLARLKNRYPTPYYLFDRSLKKGVALDSNIVMCKEHRRILMGLRSVSQKPLTIKVEEHNKHVRVRFPCKLPAKEATIAEIYGWPSEKVENQFIFTYPISVWRPIHKQFIALGFAIDHRRRYGGLWD